MPLIGQVLRGEIDAALVAEPIEDARLATRPIFTEELVIVQSVVSSPSAGKGVTLVHGLPLDEDALKALAKQLRNACGCGGTVKDGVIEIQGDQRERVAQLLQAQGWSAKLAGG